MKKIQVIENELVPVYETETGEKVINGRELHSVLQSKQDFSTWVKKRLAECDANKGIDYDRFHEKMEANNATMIEYIIKLNIAKEMAMLERNEKGKQVRRYFIQVEEKYKQQVIDRQQLSPHTQALMALTDSIARTELEQKRQAKEIEEIKNNQKVISETFSKDSGKDFRPWVNKCITAIVESSNYPFIGSKEEKYQSVRKESYDRLNQKKPCRLKQRVESEKGRALTAGASAARVNSINKLTIIENDKALKPIYETVLKEMMIAYCVDTP